MLLFYVEGCIFFSSLFDVHYDSLYKWSWHATEIVEEKVILSSKSFIVELWE
jgi:hypothetical protein